MPKNLDTNMQAVAFPDKCCRVSQFESVIADGLAAFRSELHDGLELLQRQLVCQFETALADVTTCSVRDGGGQSAGAQSRTPLPDRVDAEGVCMVHQGAESVSDSQGKPLICRSDEFVREAEKHDYPKARTLLAPTAPAAPRPPSPRLSMPPDLEPCREVDDEERDLCEESDCGSHIPHNCLVSLGSGDEYTPEELAFVEQLRHSRSGRWAALALGLLDMVEGAAAQVHDDDGKDYELWEAWTTRTRVRPPARGQEKSVVLWGQGGLTTEAMSSRTVPWWHQMFHRCVIHPSAPLRFPWVCVGGVWILMDCIVIPLKAVELVGDYDLVVERVMLAYWAFDLLINFFVGYHTPDGSVEQRFDVICRHYLRTWFTLDLLAVFGEIGVLLFDHSAAAYGQGAWTTLRLSRSVRMIRLVKLLRLRKLKALVQEVCHDIRTDWLVLVLKIVEHLGCILLLNHYIACGWYGVSKFGERANKWVSVFDVDSRGHAYGYVLSLHWSLSQFTPSTNNIAPQSTSERLFAIVVVVFALVSFSSFVSGVTNAVNELRTMNMGMTTEGARLRSFLAKNKVSAELGSRMFHFFLQNYRRTRRSGEQDIAFFTHFPQTILISLHKELYLSTLSTIPPFHMWRKLDMSLYEKICHVAFGDGWYLPQQDVFVHGDDSHKAFFTRDASLDYTSVDAGYVEHVDIAKQTWISEVGLWIKWVHQGNLTAMNATSLVELDCRVVRSVVVAHGGAFHSCLKKFVAFFVGHLEINDVHVTDLQLDRDFQLSCAERAETFWMKSTQLSQLTRASDGPVFLDATKNLFRATSSSTRAFD